MSSAKLRKNMILHYVLKVNRLSGLFFLCFRLLNTTENANIMFLFLMGRISILEQNKATEIQAQTFTHLTVKLIKFAKYVCISELRPWRFWTPCIPLPQWEAREPMIFQDAGLDIAIISHPLNIYILIFHHPPKSIAFSSIQRDRWLIRLQAMEIWCYRQVLRYPKKINNLFKELCQMQSSLLHFVSCWLCLM